MKSPAAALGAFLVASLLVHPLGAQSESDLMRLTVPAGQLPAGCQLLPSKAGGPVPTNPAIVKDLRFLGMMHALIVGPQAGDLAFVQGALTPERARELAERTSSRAAGIEFGYAAFYWEEGGYHEIGVFALRLKERPELSAPGEGRTTRITRGSVVMFSWSDGRPASPDRGCEGVVRKHLASMDFK